MVVSVLHLLISLFLDGCCPPVHEVEVGVAVLKLAVSLLVYEGLLLTGAVVVHLKVLCVRGKIARELR